VNDRVFLPIDLIVYPQTFEEFLIAGEYFFQGREQERFTETPGPGHEIVFASFRKKLIYILCFIYIKIIALN
jgi:hypothetical protein